MEIDIVYSVTDTGAYKTEANVPTESGEVHFYTFSSKSFDAAEQELIKNIIKFLTIKPFTKKKTIEVEQWKI